MNPWLKITYSDYENHMLEVGQAQILNKLTDYFLKEYKPANFALIGCATGNGLEHVDNEITKNVHAIDINPDFIKQIKIRFENKIKNLTTHCLDLNKESLYLSNIDLVFCGLILEYIEPEKFLKNISEILHENGKIVIVIQKNKKASFVTKTKYKTLESLSQIAQEISKKRIVDICEKLNLKMIHKNEILLNENKSFVVLAFEK
jgi:ubiquinone/menaquinone biosynthesis C-methylase UbiE